VAALGIAAATIEFLARWGDLYRGFDPGDVKGVKSSPDSFGRFNESGADLIFIQSVCLTGTITLLPILLLKRDIFLRKNVPTF
jgi:hypothetical protein